jgi:hypothetical protein
MSKSEGARRYAEWIWDDYLDKRVRAAGEPALLQSARQALIEHLQLAKRALSTQVISNYAAAAADRALLAAIVQAGFRLPEDVLEAPVANRDYPLLDDLIELGANVHGYCDAGYSGIPGPWLFRAVAEGDAKLADYLIARGVDVNRHYDDDTALRIAARHGHLACVALLLKHGAEPAARSWGGTARQIAEARGHTVIAALLEGYE